MAVSRAANSDTFKATTPSDREIVLTRLFDAPRRLVFEAMTKPEHVRRWWGILDDEHSVPVCEIDLRPGGAWRFVGRGPKGEYAFYGVYREIAAARTRRLHRDLRAVSRRRIGRDLGAHRGGRQDASHRHLPLSVAGSARHGAPDRHDQGRRHQLRPARRPRRSSCSGPEPQRVAVISIWRYGLLIEMTAGIQIDMVNSWQGEFPWRVH